MNSVCIAVYNGSKYINQQLSSILVQISENDEVIIIDDASTDDTVNVINNIVDIRVTLHKNDLNMGVIFSFDRAIRLAKGNIIYLADQDDIWHDDKINVFTKIFFDNPTITLLLSDANIIDAKGKSIHESFFELRGDFSTGILSNCIKNKYLGCVMAFRSDMLDYIIPIPPDIPMHDMWIGLINSIFGNVLYVDMKLVGYRRHDNNATSFKHSGGFQMLKWRLVLLYRLFQRNFKMKIK
jgi:glycosyltransferase involved in cell wall biosynthesis